MAIGRQWNEYVISNLLVAFLFICVAILGGFLYLAQRHHPEYLWLACLCLSVAASGAADSAFGLAVMPLSAYRIFTMFSGRIFMAITLEFVLHFTGTKSRKFVRGVQIGVLLVPFVSFHPLDSRVSDPLGCLRGSVLRVGHCFAVPCLATGRSEAGVMLLPFFLAAIGRLRGHGA